MNVLAPKSAIELAMPGAYAGCKLVEQPAMDRSVLSARGWVVFSLSLCAIPVHTISRSGQ
jgi:hypothetical protein